MKEIINAIFQQSGFNLTSFEGSWLFFENKEDNQQSYILVNFTTIDTIKGYMESEDFEVGLTLFQKQQTEKADIEKNTSLVIIANTSDLESDFQGYKNSILEVEEDEFWFKKYVLVYNEPAMEDIDGTQNVIEQLTTKVLNTAQFTSFRQGMFIDPLYFVSMQIFLKLPFLNVPIALREEYLSIDTILENNLSTQQLAYMQLMEGEMDNITDAEWSQLRTDCIDITNSQRLDTFFYQIHGQ